MVDGLQSDSLARDLLDERKTKELKLSENNVLIDLNVEKQNRRETEAKISKIIDERLYTIRLDLAKEKKVREESQDQSYGSFGEQIARLRDEIQTERFLKDEANQGLIAGLSEEVGRFHELVFQERSLREQANQQVREAIEDLRAKVFAEVQAEAANRR